MSLGFRRKESLHFFRVRTGSEERTGGIMNAAVCVLIYIYMKCKKKKRRIE